MPINSGMGKQMMVCSHNGVLPNNEKGHSTVACHTVEGSLKHDASQKKADAKEDLL